MQRIHQIRWSMQQQAASADSGFAAGAAAALSLPEAGGPGSAPATHHAHQVAAGAAAVASSAQSSDVDTLSRVADEPRVRRWLVSSDSLAVELGREGEPAGPGNTPRSVASPIDAPQADAATLLRNPFMLPEHSSADAFREAALLRIRLMIDGATNLPSQSLPADRSLLPAADGSASADAPEEEEYGSASDDTELDEAAPRARFFMQAASAAPPAVPAVDCRSGVFGSVSRGSTEGNRFAAPHAPSPRTRVAFHPLLSAASARRAAHGSARVTQPTPPPPAVAPAASASAMPPSPFLPPSRGPDTLTHVYQGIATMRTLLSAMGWGVESSTGYVAGPPAPASAAAAAAAPPLVASPFMAPLFMPPADALRATAAAMARNPAALPPGLPASEAAVRHRAQRNAALARPRSFQVGQWVDALDTVGSWLEATVLAYEERADGRARVYITYNGWPARWDEWIDADSPRLAPFRVHSMNATLRLCASPHPFNMLEGGPLVGPPSRPVTPAAWALEPSQLRTPAHASQQPGPLSSAASAAASAASASPPVHWPVVDPRVEGLFGGRPSVTVPFGADGTSAIGMALHHDDPRAALPAVSDAARLVAQLLGHLTEVASGQIERECRRSIAVASAHAPVREAAAPPAGPAAAPPDADACSTTSSATDLSDLSDPAFAEPPPRGEAPVRGSPTRAAAAPAEAGVRAGGGVQPSAVGAADHFSEDRADLSALARQLAPLLDRFGRVLTDLAPFVEAMGRVPTFVPAAIRVVPAPEGGDAGVGEARPSAGALAAAPPSPSRPGRPAAPDVTPGAAAAALSPLAAAVARYVAAATAAAASRSATEPALDRLTAAPSPLEAALARCVASSAALSAASIAASAAVNAAAAASAAVVASAAAPAAAPAASVPAGDAAEGERILPEAVGREEDPEASIRTTLARIRARVDSVRAGTAALRRDMGWLNLASRSAGADEPARASDEALLGSSVTSPAPAPAGPPPPVALHSSSLFGAPPAAAPASMQRRALLAAPPALRTAVESQYTDLVMHPPPVSLVQPGMPLPISTRGVTLAAILQGLPPLDVVTSGAARPLHAPDGGGIGAAPYVPSLGARAALDVTPVSATLPSGGIRSSSVDADRMPPSLDYGRLALDDEDVPSTPEPLALPQTPVGSTVYAAAAAASQYVPITEAINFSPGRGPPRALALASSAEDYAASVDGDALQSLAASLAAGFASRGAAVDRVQ